MSQETIGAFVAALKRELRIGHVAPESEHHLRREFATLGWNRDVRLHAGKVDEEIVRLETQARVLRQLRVEAFGEVVSG